MSSRREFLLQLFRFLDERSVAFCVLRNFDEVFAPGTSDVDLLTRSADVPIVRRACDDAAAATGHRLVQRTRFVNHSAVFWDGGAGLVRIDIDTEIRWRCWPVLSADEVLAERIQRAEFPIPCPRHEAEIIRSQLVWKGRVSESYARRLAELGAPPPDVAGMRRAILRRTLLSPRRWWEAARFLAGDLDRWRRRMLAPPGATLEIFSAHAVDPEPIFTALAGLFPAAKGALLAAHQSAAGIVFKGGLAIRTYATPPQPTWKYARRTFLAVAESSGRTHVAHLGSGGLATLATIAEVPQFILEACAREQCGEARQRGACLALAGLDGSGKTTFARNLCAEAWRSGRFAGIRYFHWIPPLTGVPEFPWPESREVPRKMPAPRHPGAALLSALRLVKNIVLANLAWRWQVRPAVRRGELVLLDRFLFNYWLDPDSVRYAGSARWLEWVRPLLPQPDLLITLQADADTLLARKQELSREQIAQQVERLRLLPPLARRRVDLDATQSSEQLAQEALRILTADPHDPATHPDAV